MAKNYQQQGLTVEIKNTGATAIISGDLVMVGALACIAATNIEPGETGDGFAEGVFLLKKKAGVALTAGQAVTGDKGVVADKGGVPVGITWEAAEAGAKLVPVKLNIFPAAAAAGG
ncbi:capsid cement protein [Providencia rettgeri]